MSRCAGKRGRSYKGSWGRAPASIPMPQKRNGVKKLPASGSTTTARQDDAGSGSYTPPCPDHLLITEAYHVGFLATD